MTSLDLSGFYFGKRNNGQYADLPFASFQLCPCMIASVLGLGFRLLLLLGRLMLLFNPSALFTFSPVLRENCNGFSLVLCYCLTPYLVQISVRQVDP